VTEASAAIRRLRLMNAPRPNGGPEAISESSVPRCTIASASASCAGGVTRSSPLGTTATVVPPAASAPPCASASMPRARPLTIV
jgi:hypothetical protein